MRPIRTTCVNCQQPILMIKSGSRTRRADAQKETFVSDSLSDTRYITEDGDVLHGVPAMRGWEKKYDLLTGYRLHKCKKG